MREIKINPWKLVFGDFLWGIPSPIPLRAVFSDRTSTPVIGFAAIRDKIIVDEKSEMATVMVGIAFLERELIVCEQFPELFIGYAEPIKMNAKGEIIENDPENVYQEWLAKQGKNNGIKDNLDGDEANTTAREPDLVKMDGSK